MKFFNKWYFIVGALFLLVAFFYSKSAATMCWDGLKVDEKLLMEKCGVTPDDYNERQNEDPDFCPEGQDAFQMIGGCGPDWTFVRNSVIFSVIAYNVVYIIVFFVCKKSKKCREKVVIGPKV